MKVYNAVVMGSGGVGKSALTVMQVSGTRVDSYDPTIEDSYRTKPLLIDNELCMIEILDTAGIEQFTSLTEVYIRNGEGFVLVYSITQPDSLEDLRALHDRILRVKDPPPKQSVPFVLVGNKCDLADTDREVSIKKAQCLADKWNCPFYETSAVLNLNVSSVFSDMVRQIRLLGPPDCRLSSNGPGGRRKRSRKCVIL